MSVQRYEYSLTRDYWMDPADDGVWMLYPDHVAALAEAEAWCLGERVVASAEGYERGLRDERKHIRKRVEAIPHEDYCCTRGCACQSSTCAFGGRCNCMAGLVIGAVLAVIDEPTP